MEDMLITKASANYLRTFSANSAQLRCVVLLAAITALCWETSVWAQAPDSQPSDTSQSWTKTGESHDGLGTLRTVESHTNNGDRISDTHSVQQRLADGRYQTSVETSKETIRVNSSTVRTITRTFGPDGSGGKRLLEITEDETQSLPDGGSRLVRTTSRTDQNGNLKQVQREVGETRKVSADTEETTTTVLRPSVNGGMAPAAQIEGHRKRDGNNTEYDQTTRILDGSGNWQISQMRQGTIQEDANNRTTEERLFLPDNKGNLSETSRNVSKESDNGSGEKQNINESYAIDLPGSTRDGSLHLVQRETTKESVDSEGRQTSVQQVEQPNPGDPGAGLRVIMIGTENDRSGPMGTRTTRTTQVRDANGNLNVVSVDFSKSDQSNAVQVEIAPFDKAK